MRTWFCYDRSVCRNYAYSFRIVLGVKNMSQKQRITYDSVLDALVAVAKQLSRYEDRYRISSEDFFHRFSSGQMEDTVEFVEWSNAYRHFLSLRGIIEKQVCHAA